MIMAAGVGTRLDPLTQIIPKPMIPIANVPIMELILIHLKNYGIKDIIANTHYLAEAIQKKFENNNLGINFNSIYEEDLSGTAGGVKKCEHFFHSDETFIVISGDALTDVNINDLVKKHKSTGAIATMALKEVPYSEISHFGVVVIDNNSRIVEFQEKPAPEEAKSNLVNTGIYVFEPEIFNYIPENTFYDFAKNVFPSLMADNKFLCGHKIKEYWNDIGTLNQYRMSSYDVLNQKINIDFPYKKTEAGWISNTSKIGSKVIFDGNIIIGNDTTVNNNVRFHGNSVIGNNCIIKKDVHIRNTIIWDNVVVEEGARLDGCIIASNTVIGKKSIIMPGSIIPESCVLY